MKKEKNGKYKEKDFTKDDKTNSNNHKYK